MDDYNDPEQHKTTAVSLCLPDDAVVGTVEEAVEDYFAKHDPAESLRLDLSQCRYIETPTLIYLIALLRGRLPRTTTLKLPEYKPVRDFLRVWQFPRAVRDATGTALHRLVDSDDLTYFGENQTGYDIKYAARILPEALERLLSSRFFAISTTWLDSAASSVQLVRDAAERWNEVHIRSVLSRYLSGPDGYFASRVIFETLTNAVVHPHARIVQTVSQFANKAPGVQDGAFTLVVWDDGESMISTLKEAVHAKRPVRASDHPDLYATYELVVKDNKGEQKNAVLHSDFLPTADTPDEELLLATTFPGITRNVAGHGDTLTSSHPDRRLNGPGMGLYVLANCVLDIFGGTIAFRTGRFFMNLKLVKPNSKNALSGVRYRAKVRRFSDSMPSFTGNMITIRIPIRREIGQ